MKKLLVKTLFILLMSNCILFAQDKNSKKLRIQLDAGIANTFHYDAPVTLNQCDEGCFAEEQESRIAPNIQLSLYKDIGSHSSLKLGVGSFSYRYFESGQAGVGDGSFAGYEFTNTWNFYNVSVGYRYLINPEASLGFYVESDIIYDIPARDYDLISGGLSIAPKLGAQLSLSENWNLIAQGFFKTAVTSYSTNNAIQNNDYLPYAYGLQVGVNVQL